MPGESGVFVIDDDESESLLDLEEFDVASTSTSATQRASRLHIQDAPPHVEVAQTNVAAPTAAAVAAATPRQQSAAAHVHADDDSKELTDDDDDEFHIAEEDSAAASFSLTSAVGASHAASSMEPFLLSELAASSGILKKSPARHASKSHVVAPPMTLTSSPSTAAMSRLMESIREVDRKPSAAAAELTPSNSSAHHPTANTQVEPNTTNVVAAGAAAARVVLQFPEVVFRVLTMLRVLKLWQQATLFTPPGKFSTIATVTPTKTLKFIQSRLTLASRDETGNIVQWNLAGIVPAIRLVRLAVSSSVDVADELVSEDNISLLLEIADTAASMLIQSCQAAAAASSSRSETSSSIWLESSVVVMLHLVWEVIAIVSQNDKGAHNLAALLQEKRLRPVSNSSHSNNTSVGISDILNRCGGDPFALAMNAARLTGLTTWTEHVLSAMHDVVLLGRWQQHYLMLSQSAALEITALHQVSCERVAAAAAASPSTLSYKTSSSIQFVGTPTKVVGWKNLLLTMTASLESLVSDVASLLHNDHRGLVISTTSATTKASSSSATTTGVMESSTTSSTHNAPVIIVDDGNKKVQQLITLLYTASVRTAVFISSLKQLQRSSSSSSSSKGGAFSQSIAMLSACVISIATTCLECCVDGAAPLSSTIPTNHAGGDELSTTTSLPSSFVVESLLSNETLGTWFMFMEVLVHAHNDASLADPAMATAVSDGDRSDAAWSRVSLFDKPLSSFYFGGSQQPRVGGGPGQLNSLTSSLNKRDLNPNGGSPVDVLGTTARLATKDMLSEVLDQFSKLLKEIDKRLTPTQSFEGQYRRGTMMPAVATYRHSSMQGGGAVEILDPSVKHMCAQFYSACMSHRSALASALTISSCFPLRTMLLQMLLHFASHSPGEHVSELLGPRTLLRSAAIGSTDDMEASAEPADRLHVILPCARLLYRVIASSGCSPNGSEAAVAVTLIKRLTEVYPSVMQSSSPNGNHISLQHEVKSGIGALASALVRIAEDGNSDEFEGSHPPSSSSSGSGWSRVVVSVDNYGGALLSTLVDCVTKVPLAVDSVVPVLVDLDHGTTSEKHNNDFTSRKYLGLTASSLTAAALHASAPALRVMFLTLLMHWLEVDVTLCDAENVQNDLLALMLSGGSPADMGAVASTENPVMCLTYVLLQVPLLHGTLVESSVQRLLRTSVSMLTTLGCDMRSMFSASRYISSCITSKQFAKKAAMDAASLVSQLLLLPVVNRNIESITLAQVVLAMASLAVSDKGVFDLIKQDSVNAERMFLAVLTACNVKPTPSSSSVTPPASPLLVGSPHGTAGTTCGLSKRDLEFIAEVWDQIVKARQEHSDSVKHESERKILQEAALSMEELRRKYEAEVEHHEKTKKSLEQSVVMLNATAATTNASSFHGSDVMSSPHFGTAADHKKLNAQFDQSSRSVDVLSMHSSDRTTTEISEAQCRVDIETEALVSGYLELLREKDELAKRNEGGITAVQPTLLRTTIVGDEECNRLRIEASWLRGSLDLVHLSAAYQSDVSRRAILASAISQESIEEAVSPTRRTHHHGSSAPSSTPADSELLLHHDEYSAVRSAVVSSEYSERTDLLMQHHNALTLLRSVEVQRGLSLAEAERQSHYQSAQQRLPTFMADVIGARDKLMIDSIAERVEKAFEFKKHEEAVLEHDRKNAALRGDDNTAAMKDKVSACVANGWMTAKQTFAEHLLEESHALKAFVVSSLALSAEHHRLLHKRRETEMRDQQVQFQNERRDREKQIREESMTAFSTQVATSAKIQLELDALKISYAKLDAESKEEIRCALEGSGLNSLYKKKEDLLKSLHQAKVADLQRSIDVSQQQAASVQEKSIQVEQQHLKTIAALKLELEDLQKSMKYTESTTLISGSVHANAVAVIRDQANKLQQQLAAEEALRKQVEMKLSSASKEHLREMELLIAKHRTSTEAAQARFDQQLVRQMQDSRKEAAEREGQERVLLEQRAKESNAKASVLQARVAELDNELQSQKKQSTEDVVVLRSTVEKLQASLKVTTAKHVELEKSASSFEKLYNEERKSAAMIREQVESLRMDFNLEKLDMQRELGRVAEQLNHVNVVSDRQSARLVEQEHLNDVLLKKLAMLELEDEVMHKTRGLEAYTTASKLQSRQGESRGAHRSRLRSTSPTQNIAADVSQRTNASDKGKGSLAFEAARERDKEQFQRDRQEAASLLAQYTLAQQQYYDADRVHKGLDGSKVHQIKKLAARPSSMSGLKALSAKSQGSRKVAWAADASDVAAEPENINSTTAEVTENHHNDSVATDKLLLVDGHDRSDATSFGAAANDSKQSVTWKEPFVAATALDFQRQEYRADQDPHLHSFFRRMKR